MTEGGLLIFLGILILFVIIVAVIAVVAAVSGVPEWKLFQTGTSFFVFYNVINRYQVLQKALS